MNRKLSKWQWNLVTIFFVIWFVTAGWLLFGGDVSPSVRFAFAFCGTLGLFAGLVGKLYRAFGIVYVWLGRKDVGRWCAIGCCLLFVAAVLTPMFISAQRGARVTGIISDLKIEGLRLLEYAEMNGGSFPPDMGRGAVYRYIKPATRTQKLRRAFVWCAELGGLRFDDISHPERVVLAYDSDPDGSRFSALYLDGHFKHVRNRDQLNTLLRERPAFLAHAIHARAKRDRTEADLEARTNRGRIGIGKHEP